MSKALSAILVLAFLIASLSCQSVFHASDARGVLTSSTLVTALKLPQSWSEPAEGGFIQGIEVRRGPNSPDDEFFFAGLPYYDNNYAHEVDPKMPPVQYARNKFVVNFSPSPQARVATSDEWESGSRIVTRPRPVYPKGQDNSSGELEYRQRRYSKVGKYWGSCMLSPTGKWLAMFSYSGEMRSPDLLFGGSQEPLVGDAFWQIHDAITGQRVFEWRAMNVKNPTTFDNTVVWLEDRYILFQEDDEARSFTVVTLPPVTPEENPVTIQLPSRMDAAGQRVTPGESDEVWIPLGPLTKEQAEKLTARSDTEIKEVRLTRDFPQKLLLAINEEVENRRAERGEKDGSRDYHFRRINSYYYALALDDPTRTRFASKDEWDRAQSVTTRHSDGPSEAPRGKVAGTVPPYRQFAKSGTSWGSPPRLSAGEWIAVFSYDGAGQDRKMFVDVFDQRLGDKFLSTELPLTATPDALFKGAVWIDGGYILLPLDPSLDSFAFWRLP